MMLRRPLLGTTFPGGQIENPPCRRELPKPGRLAGLERLKRFLMLGSWNLPLWLLAAALAGCGGRNYSKQVELVANSDSPTPAMTFELRFDALMVKGDRVGLTATNSPLIIRPPLAGTFTWLSSRSGVFTPSEPLALDTRYDLSLRPGLLRADGLPSGAALRWTIKTPAFGILATWPQRADPNADSEPEIKLGFNADVAAAAAARSIFFRDAAGNRVMADVRQGTFEELRYNYEFASGSLHTWKADAAVMSRPAGNYRQSGGSENLTNEIPNVLIATPHDALPIGNGWKLIVARGLPAADLSLRFRTQCEVPVGDVTPFVVQQVTAHNYLNAGPVVMVEFSKPVPESLTNGIGDWIELSDVPTNVEVCVNGRRLTFSGDFKGGTSLTVKLRSGLAAIEPFTLQGSNSFEVEIPHTAPRLYFPALSQDQLAGGNRLFPLLSVNVARLRIRAKLMDPHTAIHALRGYGSYFASAEERNKNDDWDEPYRAIDYNVLPGTTIFDQEIDLGAKSADSDEANTSNLRWDDLLKGRRAGVVFLDATAVNDDRTPALGSQAQIQLTDLGLLWKKSPASVDVFVFSHTTGQPVGGAKVRLMSGENQTLRESVSDTNGLAHLDADTNADWVAVESGEDFHAAELSRNHIRPAPLPPISYGESDDEEDLRRVMLFSDRDLYRPGESMHFEAIVRDWTSQGLRVPAGLTGTLQCTDARDKVFFQTNAVFSSLGSWSVLVPLPVGSRGFYSARLHLGTDDRTNTFAFQVRDFQPSAFEISLPCQETYAADAPIKLPLSARYLFGKTLSRAQVTWSLQADDMDFRPAKFEDFSFRRTDFESRYGRGRSTVTSSGRGILTSASNFIIAPKLPVNPVAPQPRAV